MNKNDFISAVASKSQLSKADAQKAIEAVFETITDALTQGDRVQIIGFGSFETRKSAARVGRNPTTGETMDIAASCHPTFKAGSLLKKAVSKKK